MLEDKKQALRNEIARREKELAKLEALPDLTELVDGSVIALFVSHGRSNPYTYVAYLVSGYFYVTGQSSPNKVNADQLATWLTTSGRRLRGAQVLAVIKQAEISSFDLAAALLDDMMAPPVRGEAPDAVYASRAFGDGPW